MTGNISAKADKAAAKKPKKVSKYSKRKVDPAFYWMTIPAMILVCIFLYLPFLQGAMYSFTNSQGYGDYKFIGFKNYIAMFQDARVGHAYLFTIFIAILITLGTNILGMFLAVLLNSKIAFKNGFRAIFFIPYTLSVLVIGYVFKYIFMTPLPALGQALHIDWLSTSMISNPDLAWFPIVFLSIWQGVAYSTLLYLAGLQTIDNEIYDAASIDGVNAWQNFWQITFPLIGPFKVLGDEKKNAITCRPADLLEPELDKIEAEMKQWKQQDEDVLSYALFPQVATEFFKYREAQQKKVDATIADTKNGAYPV